MTLDKITSVLATGGKHLGDLVYWSLTAARSTGKRWRTSGGARSSRPRSCRIPPGGEYTSTSMRRAERRQGANDVHVLIEAGTRRDLAAEPRVAS
jgi:hypothetical protein